MLPANKDADGPRGSNDGRYKTTSIFVRTAAAAAKSLQSCQTLGDPMDGSLPGSSIHGIFQARALEWGAIAFSFVRTLLIK